MDATFEQKSFLFSFWRPLTGYVYIAICLFDFIIGPIAQPLFLHFIGLPPTPWISLTLSYGGIFHIGMVGILGTTAYTHGMANIENIKNMPDYSNVPLNEYSNNPAISDIPPLRHVHRDFSDQTTDLGH